MAITDNLISYWKLDENSGNISDSVGSNTGTNVGSVSFTTGKINNGALLNGSKYFTFSNETGTDFKPSEFTVAFWINTSNTGTGYYPIFHDCIINNNDYSGFSVNLHSSKLHFEIYPTNGTGTTVSALSDTSITGSFKLIIVERSGTTNSIYINNSFDKSFTSNNPSYDTNTKPALGAQYSNGSYTSGDIGILDAVGFWSRPLTSDEKSLLWNNGNGIQYPFTTTKTYLGFF